MIITERADRPVLTGWTGVGLCLLTGMAVGLGQVPFALLWLALPALAIAIHLFLACASPSAAFRRGWILGAGYALVVLFWIVEPFLVDVARHGWMAPFALLLMAAGFGLFWGAAFSTARWLVPEPGQGALVLAVTWTASEMLRSYAFTGFPWALVSYIWTETPLLQLSAYAGPHGLTLLTLIAAAGLVQGWRSNHRVPALAAWVAGGAVLFAAGLWQQSSPVPGSDGTGPVVRLIQPNADQRQKWDPAMAPVFYQRQLALTSEAAAPPPELVVWPEVAVPFVINDPDAPLWEIAGAGNGARVILGAFRQDDRGIYNSLVVLGKSGNIDATYDKVHLVPFGEYLPFEDLWHRFGLSALAIQLPGSFTAGDGVQLLDLGPLGLALPLICYEGIFPHEVRRSSRPDWLLMVTNDGWFGTLSGPYQHLAQARARSVELGLPMVRVANTGISAMIDARGRVSDSVPLGVAGSLDAVLPTALPPTIYARAGDLPVLLLLALFLAIVSFRRIRLTRS